MLDLVATEISVLEIQFLKLNQPENDSLVNRTFMVNDL